LIPAKFIKLLLNKYKKVYRYYLVKEGYIQIEEGNNNNFFNLTIADSILLRQEYILNSNTASRQIVQEVQEVYYTKNTFTV
jgi:hypothetical protein